MHHKSNICINARSSKLAYTHIAKPQMSTHKMWIMLKLRVYLKSYTSALQVLTKIASKHINKTCKSWYAKNIKWKIEIVTKIDWANLYFSETRWSSDLNSLIVMHPLIYPSCFSCIHNQGIKPLTSCESPYLHKK